MISSPDLLAFSGAEGFTEGSEEDLLEARSLPEELSVPLVGPDNPWSSCARFNRDFILVAEFSEQVGPSPVLTIPDDPRVTGTFDLNHFSVRIMSVDYQASGPAPVPPVCPGPRLNFSEDSRVVLGDSAEDAYAYVHHVTLLDLEARGMVRPFCMAYVCSDQAKLMENFSELSASFSKASDSLKTGNRQAFSMELQRKLQDLDNYGKMQVFLLVLANISVITGTFRYKREATRMNSVCITSCPYSLMCRFKRRSLKQETSLCPATEAPTGEHSDLELSISTHRELLRQVTSYPNRKLKQPDFLPYDPADSLPESSFLPPEASAVPRSEHQELKSLAELCNPYFLSLMKEQLADTEQRLRGDRSVLQTSNMASSLSKSLTLTNFLFELGSSEDGEEEETSTAVNGAQSSSETLEAEPLSLDSFCSCVEELPIKMEPQRRRMVTPSVSVEMIFEAAVSAEMTGSVSSNDSIEVLGTEKSFRTQNVKRVPVDVAVRWVRAYARRTNSEDSIEVLSTTDSIFPEDLAAITEETEHSPLTNGFQPAQRHHNYYSEAQEQQGTAASHTQGKYLVIFSDKHWSLSAVARWSQSPARLLSVDERSDCTSATGSSSQPALSLLVHGLRSRLRRRRKAGLRALRFIKQHSFSQHALFCLLSGRPLVVVGGDEALVRKVVHGLSLFVPAPGPDERAVMPSLSRALQLTDLLAWRLIGIHSRWSGSASSSAVHSLSHYSRYLSVLDLDQKTLKAPSYSGSLIGRLADGGCGFSRGLTYLLHLESELSALQNQALLYSLCPQRRQRPLLSECDLRVLHFLSDLMAQRHTSRGPPVLGFTYSAMQLHRNSAAT
uniref:UDENN FLCN/SMCR8-type domain-containing protein n=1 Tax=Neogobius melanostomus TaxID=47308 RepID=A0A8C6TDF7_9GOBI